MFYYICNVKHIAMRKAYYIFNPDTRTYDRVHPTFTQKFLTILRSVLLYITFGGVPNTCKSNGVKTSVFA